MTESKKFTDSEGYKMLLRATLGAAIQGRPVGEIQEAVEAAMIATGKAWRTAEAFCAEGHTHEQSASTGQYRGSGGGVRRPVSGGGSKLPYGFDEVVQFGKYSGSTLRQIARNEAGEDSRSYLEWMAKAAKSEDMRALASKALSEIPLGAGAHTMQETPF